MRIAKIERGVVLLKKTTLGSIKSPCTNSDFAIDGLFSGCACGHPTLLENA
jgi:hypothetical protein